jgi:hypothetical protein
MLHSNVIHWYNKLRGPRVSLDLKVHLDYKGKRVHQGKMVHWVLKEILENLDKLDKPV